MYRTAPPACFDPVKIIRGLRGLLSDKPLPSGQRIPAAAVAAAAAAAAGDSGLRSRARTALWPALRAFGRVPCLRDVSAELSRVVYHEVFLSLQVCGCVSCVCCCTVAHESK